LDALDQTADILVRAVVKLGDAVASLFLSRTSNISLWSLLSTLLIAVIWLTFRRQKRPSRGLAKRVLLPKGYFSNESAKTDWLLLLANNFCFPVILAAAVWTSAAISGPISEALGTMFGAAPLENTSPWLARGLTTLAMYLAYEFAYFSEHYLFHRIPFLWHFHKVHHSATSLSPITNFRVHPVDSLIFANVIACCVGATAGVCTWLFGARAAPFAIDGTNVLLVFFAYCLLHLQHSQLWIVFKGPWSKLLMSPAAHQLHHSNNPDHFNCNYGNAFSLWDRIFGTYRQPDAKSMRLKFGVEDLGYNPHGLHGTLIMPFIDAVRSIWPQQLRPASARAAANLQTTHP
jgi:sterol desaturase/sphingolipid hydroxylase (fatty acid hydroxylase superfamily)